MIDWQSVCGIFLGMNSKNKAAIGEGMEYMRIFAKAALKTAYAEHWEAIKKHADDWLVQVCFLVLLLHNSLKCLQTF